MTTRLNMALRIVAACGVLAAPAAARPQDAASSSGRLAFEAATVKPAAPDAVRNRVMPAGPNRLRIPSMTLTWLVYTAYGNGGLNTSVRVEGGPDWVNRTSFAVEGVAAASATPRELRLMLQTLLEDRFALEVRRETRMNDVLTLVIDRPDGQLGPKVKEWDGTCQRGARPLDADEPVMPRCVSGYRPGGISLDGATMFSVAEVLSLPQGRVLLGGVTQDRTGLAGRYTMELDYPFARRPGDPAAPPDGAAPSLSTAIREQWGLRLVPGKGPLDVIIIERAQRPAAN